MQQQKNTIFTASETNILSTIDLRKHYFRNFDILSMDDPNSFSPIYKQDGSKTIAMIYAQIQSSDWLK